jgi:hypothetical protein
MIGRNSARKVLLFELNEVPYRVIDQYCSVRTDSCLARMLPQMDQYETTNEDRLALDPWISWPTFHRGVTDETHQILHLGQVIDEADESYPPIWRLLKERGCRVAVFGSLHSSSIPADVRDYDFYLPDYFDSETFAHPESLLPFQRLNLVMTRQSARNVTRKMPLGSLARFAATAPGLGLSLSTAVDSAMHLAHEVVDSSKRIRRRAYQPLVMADLFLEQMRRTQPDFATFYTNHVAAAMHRYWGATFPQDYANGLDEAWIRKYADEVFFAMDKFDIILKKMVSFVQSHPEYTLLIASSMGQAAIPAEQTYEFLTITDLPRFVAALGVPDDAWHVRPAMVPCQCLVVNEPYRAKFNTALDSMQLDDARMVPGKRIIPPMTYNERQKGFYQLYIQIDNYRGSGRVSVNGRAMSFEDAGLGLMAHEDGVNCTAQHVPTGSLLVYRAGQAMNSHGRPTVSTVDVAPSVLRHFGFAKPDYMHGGASIALG